jgi:2-amino-4-hydroxy-6-hydroxymethyldihydropteridine diphosphokinase
VSHEVALALGSSLGDGKAILRLATAALAVMPGLWLLRSSPLYATPPVGGVARNPFVNAVVYGRTDLSPRALLDRVKTLEARLGRSVSRRWADRTLDIDLLLHGETVMDDGVLALPHPRMRARSFVLVPLAAAWPEARDPRDGTRLASLPPAQVALPIVGALPNPPSPVRWRHLQESP